MANTINRLFPFIAAIAVFCAVSFFLLKSFPGAQKIEIDMEIDHPDLLRVYYSNSKNFREDAASALLPISRERANVKASLGSGLVNYIRIDTGGQKGTAKIYQVTLFSYFHAPLRLGPKEIGELFIASSDASIQVFADHVAVISSGNDPYLYCKKRLFKPRYLQSFAIALVFAGLAGILVSSRRYPPETGHELPVRPPSEAESSGRLDALDGLRGIAALMVVADHTWGWFRGVGASGVWIFFALSGFLLARPFIDNPRRVLSFAYMAGYFRRRFMRILPMYFVYIFVVFVMNGRLNLAIMHGLFLEGDGHLWAIPQEMLFYLLWPCVVVLLVLPLKRFPGITMLGLLLALAVWNRFAGIDFIWLLGMDHVRLPLFFGVFLVGVFFSFVYSIYSAAIAGDTPVTRIARRLASPVGCAILLFFFLLSTGHIFGQNLIYSQKYFGYYGFLAGALIFCVLLAKGRVLGRVLTLAPLRELGIAGFSLYLVHPLVKNIVADFFKLYFDYKIENLPLFLATLGCSYLLARYTYRHIEQPGFQGKR